MGVDSVAFGAASYDADHEQLIGTSSVGGCWAWDSINGDLVRELVDKTNRFGRISVAPGGRAVAAITEGGGIRIWQLDRGIDHSIAGKDAMISALAWSNDATQLASGDERGAVQIWDPVSGEKTVIHREGEQKGFSLAITDLTWHPSCNAVAVVNRFGELRTLDARSGEQIANASIGTNPMFALAFSPDGSCLAMAGKDGQAAVWKVNGTHLVPLWKARGSADTLTSIVFDSSGSRVAISGRDRQVRVWQTLTGELIAVCRGLTANVYALGFTQDNHTIVASDGDGVIARWNVETGTLESKIQRVSPFGNQVMQDASEKYAHLWQRVASHYDWTKFRCGCGNSARHIPVDFASFVSTNPEECARAMGVEGHAEEQGMLFEASVPTAEMLLASLQDAILSESARAQVLYLLLTLAEGESHYTEVENGRPDLELECREVMRRNKSALRLQLGEKNSSLCAEYASDILRLIS